MVIWRNAWRFEKVRDSPGAEDGRSELEHLLRAGAVGLGVVHHVVDGEPGLRRPGIGRPSKSKASSPGSSTTVRSSRGGVTASDAGGNPSSSSAPGWAFLSRVRSPCRTTLGVFASGRGHPSGRGGNHLVGGVAGQVVEVVGHRAPDVFDRVPVQGVEDRQGGGGPVRDLRDADRPRQVGPGALAGEPADVPVRVGGPALDDGQGPVQIGREEPPDREFRGEPRRQLGEERQAVLEIGGLRRGRARVAAVSVTGQIIQPVKSGSSSARRKMPPCRRSLPAGRPAGRGSEVGAFPQAQLVEVSGRPGEVREGGFPARPRRGSAPASGRHPD